MTMNHPLQKIMDRREFLRDCLRWPLLGAAAAAAVVLTARKKKDGKTVTVESCLNQNICRSCREVRFCQLPLAQSFRAVTERQSKRDPVK